MNNRYYTKKDPFNYFFISDTDGFLIKDSLNLLIPTGLRLLILVNSIDERQSLLQNITIKNTPKTLVAISIVPKDKIELVFRENSRFYRKIVSSSKEVSFFIESFLK